MKKYLPDLLLILGASLISIGTGMAWLPAGFATAGVLCIYAGVKTA